MLEKMIFMKKKSVALPSVKHCCPSQRWIGSPNFGGIFFQGAPKKIKKMAAKNC
jgi:hypothetical protein